MDRFDKKILFELQLDGRLTVTELAERIGLSLSPCHRRLKALEQAGAIRDYRAQLDPVVLGLNFSALLFVTMRDGNQGSLVKFEAALIDIPQVIEAKRLFGDPDYMLNVVVKDLEAFQKLYDDQLSALPGVQRLTSTLVMKSVIQNRELPL
ncbi:MAG: Lrp/AsnC family transcriptional regulator [Thiothrix sp.]|nr:Lrp/AsnC family transcriptional regulator [Thiothrix sp.]HPQ95267.1 Lrp/AsnC family transcriptional regulator [Thiolinea sp.]